MISTQDIKNKEVINIYDGRSLGFVYDIELNLERGTIEGIIVPEQRGFFHFFGRENDFVIKWKDIKRIGDDVILVDVAGIYEDDLVFDREPVRGMGREPFPEYDQRKAVAFMEPGSVESEEEEEKK